MLGTSAYARPYTLCRGGKGISCQPVGGRGMLYFLGGKWATRVSLAGNHIIKTHNFVPLRGSFQNFLRAPPFTSRPLETLATQASKSVVIRLLDFNFTVKQAHDWTS